MTQNEHRVLLVILDGFGESKARKGNAIAQANMKTLKKIKKEVPWTILKASGNDVGLPKGVQGNSEVGHFTMGSGRITHQTLEAINRTIRSGEFFKLNIFKKSCEHVKSNPKRTLHLIGMISDQGVHSHIDHLFALLKMAENEGLKSVAIHAILDGRDVPERSADRYLKKIRNTIKTSKSEAHIATMIGRFYAMDRDHNWDRTKQAYNLFVKGEGTKHTDPLKALNWAYAQGVETDYYVPPICLDPTKTIKNGDAVIFFNYRTDRARQLTESFLNKKFDQFSVTHGRIKFIAMGDYTKLAPVAFPAPRIQNNLSEVLSKNKIAQLRMAETEKYAHVTYFFNSQIEKAWLGEDRSMVDSPKCTSYADQPEMSAKPLTQKCIQILRAHPQKYQFIAINYANADLVGHSGSMKATVQCCKVLDECLSKLVPVAQKNGFSILITADHGNAEQMFYKNGEPCPSHTTNPVPFLLISKHKKGVKLKSGGLEDVAPTILELLKLKKPKQMTGNSLISIISHRS